MKTEGNEEGTRTPRQMLVWLFGETRYFDRGRLNTAQLAKDMRAALGTGAPSQSTLHRMFAGVTRQADDATLAALSRFTEVDIPLIRGEASLNAAEEWGMQITVGEARMLRALRELNPEQRKLIYEQVRLMLPAEKQNLVPRLSDNVIPWRPKSEHP